MNRILPVVVAVIFGVSAAYAGTVAENPTFTDTLSQFRTPATPGAVLLANQPKIIEKPQTPRALALSMSSLVNPEGEVPSDFAVEFAPYWMTSHPMLTFEEYYHPGILRCLLMNSSVSLATSLNSETEDSVMTMGVGVKTLLYRGHAAREKARIVKEIQTMYHSKVLPANWFVNMKEFIAPAKSRGEILSVLDTAAVLEKDNPDVSAAISLVRKIVYAVLDSGACDSSAYDRIQERLENNLANEIKKLLKALPEDRKGWVVELAASAVADFPGAVFREGTFSRFGLWVTPMYSLEKQPWELLGVMRYIFDRDNSFHNADGGFAVNFSQKQYSVSFEAIGRMVVDSAKTVDYDWHSAVHGEMKMENGVTITASLGKDFTPYSDRRNMIVAINASFGAGTLPLLRLR